MSAAKSAPAFCTIQWQTRESYQLQRRNWWKSPSCSPTPTNVNIPKIGR